MKADKQCPAVSSVGESTKLEASSLVLAGYYPPPFGGESVHIRELARRLRADGLHVRIVNLRRGAPSSPEYRSISGRFSFVLVLMESLGPRSILHLHSNGHNWKSWLMISVAATVLRLRRARGVLTLHSGLAPDYLAHRGPFSRRALRLCLASFGHIICVNATIREALVRLGVSNSRSSVIPAYVGLPAAAPLSSADTKLVEAFDPLLVACGGAGPEYGFPILIKAVANLRQSFPKLGCVMMGSAGSDALRRLIDSLGVADRVTCIENLPHEQFAAILSCADVFVRPSYADGDAVSVREALALGIPVVASDTDSRPDGVILFRRGDVDELCRKVASALERGRATENTPPAAEPLPALLAIYQNL